MGTRVCAFWVCGPLALWGVRGVGAGAAWWRPWCSWVVGAVPRGAFGNVRAKFSFSLVLGARACLGVSVSQLWSGGCHLRMFYLFCWTKINLYRFLFG